MRFLVDECCEPELAAVLRSAGHDVAYVAEDDRAASDVDVLGRSVRQGRILITDDKDFGDLAVRNRRRAVGVVLIRIDKRQKALRVARLTATVTSFGPRLVGNFCVVRASVTRARALDR